MKHPIDLAPNKPQMPKPLEVRLANESMDIGIYKSEIAVLGPSKYPPWCRPEINICTCREVKQQRDSQIIKAEFLEHSAQHSSQCSIYTDGSKSSNGVGSAAVISDTVVKRKLPPTCFNFTAEIQAVLMAVKNIFYTDVQRKQYVIYTDSNSVLYSLRKLIPTHPLVQEVQDWLVLLHSRKPIRVSFCQDKGNEKADKASKMATDLQQVSSLMVPHSDFREVIHKYVMEKWQTRWNSLLDNQKLKGIRPSIEKWESSNCPNRRDSVVLTRLRIGHSYFSHAFLKMRGDDRQVPQCHVCHCVLTVRHILIECNAFNHQRQINSLHGRSMKELLDNDCNVDKIMKFL